MKFSSIKYLTREGIKNTWANRLMTLASVGVLVACMVIIGLAMLLTENINKAVGTLEQQNVAIAYMKDYNWALYSDEVDTTVSEDTTSSESDDTSSETEDTDAPDANGIRPSDYVIHNEEEARALCDEIAKIPNVLEVVYISSEEGLENVKNSMIEGQEEYFTFLDDEYGNPISCAAKIVMEDMSLFGETIAQVETLDGIDVIQSQGDLAETITTIKKGIGVAGVWIIAILMVISLVIVSNTIRVTMYSRKLEISIMKAVGATDTFVRIPFIVEGVIIGLVSAFIAEGLLYFCYRVATENLISTLNSAEIIAYGDMAWLLLAVFCGIGLFAGVVGSLIIISKYLRHEGSEFTAL